MSRMPGPAADGTPTDPGSSARALMEPGRRMRGTTAGAVVLVGLVAANGGNAVFHLIAARSLGPSKYSDLVTLVAIVGLLAFPLGGVQFAIAQRTAQWAARADRHAIGHLYRRGLVWSLMAGAALFVVVAVCSGPIQRGLHVGSRTAVILMGATLVPTIVSPMVLGLAQGLERFLLFSFGQVVGPVARIAFLLPLIVLGAGVPGALGATFGGSLVAVVVPVLVLAAWAQRPPESAIPHPGTQSASLWGALGISVGGILGLTALTSLDVVVAKLSLTSHVAGLYGAASLVGRLILFLPSAVAFVLVPKVSSRSATGRDTRALIRPSLVITGVLCLALTAAFSVAPRLLLDASFGAKYEDAHSWIWLFGIEMTCFALANVAFAYDLGRGRARGAWLLCGAAVVELIGYIPFHDSPRQLLYVNIATGALLLVAYGIVGRFHRAKRA
jgi:O-antigen/teichoic acid export membrane protein